MEDTTPPPDKDLSGRFNQVAPVQCDLLDLMDEEEEVCVHKT